jgi:hypothetical protein
MRKIKQLISAAAASMLLAIGLPLAVGAAPGDYSLFGEATYVSPGNASDRAVQTVSDDAPGFGGIDFEVESGTTFADLTILSSDFNPTDDGCAGGSPRFQIALDGADADTDADGNVFVYFGTDSAGAPCVNDTWQNSGDFLENGRLLDTTQLGGAFYDPYANALTNYGDYTVVGMQLVTDAGWASEGEQTALFDNTVINNQTYTYEQKVPANKDECKNGGWQDFEGMFKNQGDCVSYVATQGRNQGSGIPTF